MAYETTSSAVNIVKGRGKNKLVTLSISFKELDRWARRMAIDAPKLLNQSYGRAVRGLRLKFEKTVVAGGGVNGVPKWKDYEDFTRQFYTARNKPLRMGGILAERSNIVGYKINGWQAIGWKDSAAGGGDLKGWAERFQDGGDSDADVRIAGETFQSWCRDLGIAPPTAYAHNVRPLLPEPFGAYVKENLDNWAHSAYYRELAKQMQKAGGK